MKTSVVITTINAPTDAIRAWAKLYPENVIVILDRKAPIEAWTANAVPGTSVSMVRMEDHPAFLDSIGYDKYQNKMHGYVEAARSGAEVIIDTDDDNEPLLTMPRLVFNGEHYSCHQGGWVNTHRAFGCPHSWPRGLPLSAIRTPVYIDEAKTQSNIGCWQGLATVDADVDAIYRLTNGSPLGFCDDYRFRLAAGTLTPINSQATLWRRECFPLLYLPCTVSMRVCDILRGYVAQPILWAAGYRLGVCGPIVRQERNPHNLMDDFRQELPLYLGMGEAVVEKVQAVVKTDASMADNLRAAYAAIIGVYGIGDERPILEEWLRGIVD